MTRLTAPERLRFTGAYFASLRRLAGSQLATVRDGRGLVAGAVFLFGPAWAHYHLAARRSDAENHVTSCLIQAGLERAAERELMGVFLGGGATRDPEDAVLKFKRSVGGELKTFRVALVVVDKRGYDQLVQEWTRKAGRPPTWLLGYRQPAELVHHLRPGALGHGRVRRSFCRAPLVPGVPASRGAAARSGLRARSMRVVPGAGRVFGVRDRRIPNGDRPAEYAAGH